MQPEGQVIPLMGPGFILEALGSPLSPAGPPPTSMTLQDVLPMPRKSFDHFSGVQLHEGRVAHRSPGSHCSSQQMSLGIGDGLGGQVLSTGRIASEAGHS